MILIAALLVPLLIFSLWLFFRFKPIGASPESLRRFDIGFGTIALLALASTTLYFWQTTGQGVDRSWWPVLAALSCVFILVVLLILASIVRMLIFSKRRI